jgi:hypothetical protein
MISCGVSLLYSSFGMSKEKRETRLKTPYVSCSDLTFLSCAV